MSRRIIRILAFTWTLVIVHACDNKLEIDDPNRSLTEEFYKTDIQAIAAVDAIYNALIVDGMYQRITPTIGDGRGDELFSRGGFPMWELTANFIIPTTEAFVSFAWSAHYVLINRANQALENVPNVPEIDSDLQNRLMGQAYFLRAWAYFSLANMFENPPIVLESPKDQEDLYPSNIGVTQADVYEQVRLDLVEAIPLLPVNYNSVSGPDRGQTGRATKGAANALMGKLLLYQDDYDGALPFFEAVVESNEYDLAANYADLFSQDPAVEQANPGKIFWVEFTTSTAPGENWGGDPNASWRQFSALAPTYSRADFWDYQPTNFLVSEMMEERTVDDRLDPRFHATILSYMPAEGRTTAYGGPWYVENEDTEDPDDSVARFDPNLFYLKKYTLAGVGGNPFFCGINYHLIRFADVLLMYAECLANASSPDMALAAEQVQRVRDRANLPDREAEFAAMSLDQFMEQLAHERVMELAVEGHRYYDIERWGWLEPGNPKLAELRANDEEFDNYIPERKYMPIPQSELDLNENMVGNDVNGL